jgi:competence ComEA-like helix-hairpin-helix protein
VSIEEGKRRGLAPLYGLIILGATAIILEFPASWDSLPSPVLHQAGRGNCMYQAFREEECLGTTFLDQPESISRILEGIGVAQQGKWDGPEERIPCNRALKLGKDLRITAIEKIKGTHLISAGQRIDVNLADLEDLRAVPGIGPRIAERIIGQREALGRFSGLEELERIHGIGKKKLAGWAPYIEAGPLGIVGNGHQDIQTSGRLLKPQGRLQE